MAYKGRFTPRNPEKYDGDPTNIIYRSGLELRFMQYLDQNPGIKQWQSEEFAIPYYDPTKDRWRRYFVDFKVVTAGGTTLVEIKPEKQCKPPVQSPSAKTKRRLIKEQVTYVNNQAKWQAAESYCKDRKWKFKIITDTMLGGYGGGTKVK